MLTSTSHSVEERESCTAEHLSAVFFGNVETLGVEVPQMAWIVSTLSRAWDESQQRGGGNRGGGSAHAADKSRWVALFALGLWVRCMISSLASSSDPTEMLEQEATQSSSPLQLFQMSVRQHPNEAMKDACVFASEINVMCLSLYVSPHGASPPPYSLLPLLLQSSRSVFDVCLTLQLVDRGSGSNATVTSKKLYASLATRAREGGMLQRSSGGGSTPESPTELHIRQDADRYLACALAKVICELMAADEALKAETWEYMAAFHLGVPDATDVRCCLYYEEASMWLRQCMSKDTLHKARDAFANAYVLCLSLVQHTTTCAESHGMDWMQKLFLIKVRLAATQLALGLSPVSFDYTPVGEEDHSGIPWVPSEMEDVVVAVEACHLPLLESALHRNAEFFVKMGVYHTLLHLHSRIRLLMVVKFYIQMGCDEKYIKISELLRCYPGYLPPYTKEEAVVEWLLPLLMELKINGVVDGSYEYLALSYKNPFEEYPKEVLQKVTTGQSESAPSLAAL